jgi:hypothetical protein
MRRVSIGLFIVVLLLGSAVLLARPGAVAQDATPPNPAARATHPLVGAWRWDNDPSHPGTFLSYGIYHADGTYTEALPDGTVLIGVWRPTGERTADFTVFNQYTVNQKFARGEGRGVAEVDATGNVATTRASFVGRFLDGSIEDAEVFISTGTRLEVLPVISPEELAATPVPTIAAATPAP